MPPAKIHPLIQSELGQDQIQDWINWPIQPSPVAAWSNTIQPTMELAPFQRRMFDVEFPTATIAAAGQSVSFQIEVPIDQAWRLVAAQVRHTDPGGSTEYELLIDRTGPVSILTLVRIPVVANDTFYNLLARQALAAAASSGNFDKPEGPIIAVGGDVILIEKASTSTGVSTANASIRYEQIPAVRTREINTSGVTSVL